MKECKKFQSSKVISRPNLHERKRKVRNALKKHMRKGERRRFTYTNGFSTAQMTIAHFLNELLKINFFGEQKFLMIE